MKLALIELGVRYIQLAAAGFIAKCVRAGRGLLSADYLRKRGGKSPNPSLPFDRSY
jgi:hypothetical protein